ncbi:hypothetical protein N7527_009902 [Penicillium freii]|uniref:Uncharacterized protein n=1 Tax=Penicillium freii TaxID=48697 RepID=A0A124GSD7_PENFR|nr:hypothetical protein N7527_009902 [Penicillium freii]KUM64072.1 hypothetical protein ACN42_g3010 [Penicillium freii]
MLVSMKEITTPYIPQQRLKLLRIDLNHLDIDSGMTSPSVIRYFMPRTNTPKIEKIRPDLDWDWFLSQKGNFGKGTFRANYLLRRVFMDYQDWSIPESWPCEQDGTRSEEKESTNDPTFQELGHLDNTKYDKVRDEKDKPDDKELREDKEGTTSMDPEKHYESDKDDDNSKERGNRTRKPSDESHEKRNESESEKSDKEADNNHEMVIPKALDLNIRNYKTDDWLVYWTQTLYALGLPDKTHGISIARSMELDRPHKCHAWALVDVILCGHDCPSTAELIALVSWGLRGMLHQLESLTKGIEPEDVHMLNEVFPIMIIVFDQRCCARVLYGYFDGRFQVQFTPVLNFKEFTEVSSSTLGGYMGQIDKKKYYDMMHSLLRWAWPLCHHPTTIAQP